MGFAPSRHDRMYGHGKSDYHAGAYEHAFGHLRLTARSNPIPPVYKKPLNDDSSKRLLVFIYWRRGWDSLRRAMTVCTVTAKATITPGPTNMPLGIFA
jgi:hypothetical protein